MGNWHMDFQKYCRMKDLQLIQVGQQPVVAESGLELSVVDLKAGRFAEACTAAVNPGGDVVEHL